MALKKIFFLNKKIFISTLLLIFIFSLKFDFLKKFFLTYNNTIDSRLLRAYDFCSYSGVGYVAYIIKKYKLATPPKIISFHDGPELYWLFNRNKFDNNKNLIILFNRSINSTSRLNLQEYKVIDSFHNNCLYLKKI